MESDVSVLIIAYLFTLYITNVSLSNKRQLLMYTA